MPSPAELNDAGGDGASYPMNMLHEYSFTPPSLSQQGGEILGCTLIHMYPSPSADRRGGCGGARLLSSRNAGSVVSVGKVDRWSCQPYRMYQAHATTLGGRRCYFEYVLFAVFVLDTWAGWEWSFRRFYLTRVPTPKTRTTTNYVAHVHLRRCMYIPLPF